MTKKRTLVIMVLVDIALVALWTAVCQITKTPQDQALIGCFVIGGLVGLVGLFVGDDGEEGRP